MKRYIEIDGERYEFEETEQCPVRYHYAYSDGGWHACRLHGEHYDSMCFDGIPDNDCPARIVATPPKEGKPE